jgi:hypothetical protein
VKDIRRRTRRHFSAEDKIRIVLDGLRRETGALKEWVASEVRAIRDESRSETDFGRPGSLRGSVAIRKMVRRLGFPAPREPHLIDSN